MDIQIDSREKARAIKKILAEFEEQGVNYDISKLPVGDYMNLDNPRLIIDRKQNLSEIYTNICHQRKRFEAELERAGKTHRRIIILCEHGGNIKEIEDVKEWHNPQLDKTPYAWEGVKLYMEMRKLSAKFGVTFEFCKKSDTGRRIIELLR
jgi:hypothetical protein